MSETSIPSDELLKSLTDRILRLREEEDAIKADVRDVYAEAKSHGFDKTVLGKVVARLRAEEKDGDKLAETETLLDLYLSAYKGASRTHTHGHAREASQKAPAQKVDAAPATVIEPAVPVVEPDAAAEARINLDVPGPAAPAPSEVAPVAEALVVIDASVSPEPMTAASVARSLRPLCRKPDNCSGYGRNTCHPCLSAAQVAEEAA
jgi:uncharacterized protein (UPF0335 family)